MLNTLQKNYLKGMINVFRYRASIGSTTQALNAQRILSRAYIPSEVVKINSGHSSGGCIYGIEFSYEQYSNVKSILEKGGVRVREYIKKFDEKAGGK